MPIRTRKSNAGVHPGRIVLGNQRPRRTRQQIEEDDARKKAATIARREEEEGRNRHIAEVEDAIELNEEQVRIHAIRPDLRHDMPTPPPGTDSEPEEDHEIPG
jgi:hypothetical protein